MTEVINIARQYSQFPGGRYPDDGEGNGTDFRRRFLVPVLRNRLRATIELDGTAGYPSSFLEEAFGGLVRKEGFTAEEVLNAFDIVARDPSYSRYRIQITNFVEGAQPEVLPRV